MYIPHVMPRRYVLFLLGSLIAVVAVATLAKVGAAVLDPSIQSAGTQTRTTEATSIKSGKYAGTIIFEDQYGKKWDGQVDLEVTERTFTLTNKASGIKLKGALVTVVSEQGIPGGHIKFDGDRAISIKWTQDTKQKARLKIVNAKGACVTFRFCSNALVGDECQNKLK